MNIQRPMRLARNTPIRAVATAVPSSVRVFQRYGIDFCCGGRRPIGEACDERGLLFAEVARALALARALAHGR